MTLSEEPTSINIKSLSRNCNQVLILATLSSGPHHGYQLALELEEKGYDWIKAELEEA